MTMVGRNDLCWCGSGEKYKRCHLHRDQQQKLNPWDAVEANKKAFKKKKCYAQDVGLGPCGGTIIKAHTVSRGPNLSKIARKGKVFQYGTSVASLNKLTTKLKVAEIGIGDASVFYGFCGTHDRALFSNIENDLFTGRPDQCLTVAYRTLSRELYGKDAGSHLRETLRSADKGRQFSDQLLIQSLLSTIDAGNEAARADLRSTYDKLTNAMVLNSLDVLQSVILESDGELPFMFSGAWSPFTDFDGKKLQSEYADELLQQVFFSSFVGEGKGYICISWIDSDGAPGQVIANQITTLPLEKQVEACLQLVVKHVENVFFRPDWFEALTNNQRTQLDILAESGIDPFGLPPAAEINLTYSFDLPTVRKTVYSARPAG